MEIQTALGTFNGDAGHSVEVHGSFDGWGSGVVLRANGSNPNIYQGTVEVGGAAGSEVQYKFVINQVGVQVWESNGVGTGGAQNRAFNLPTTAETLTVVHFNNQSTPPGVVAVTFRVNLTIQEALGNFDSSIGHTVEAHGAFDNWGPGITLAADSANAGIYQGTFNITGSAGAAIEHKFVITRPAHLSGRGTWDQEGRMEIGSQSSRPVRRFCRRFISTT